MTEAQKNALELLAAIDENGKQLTKEEIDFVADLIDRNVTALTSGQISRIKALHRHKVEEMEEEDDDEI